MSKASSSPRPERWSAESGSRDVVKLDIPADAQRERTFEIFVRLLVVNKTGSAEATHALKVLVDGALEWQRSAATHPEGNDSLDFRLRRTVPLGRPLRLNASCELRGGAQRVNLSISAEEE